jgi:hypothetical protein
MAKDSPIYIFSLLLFVANPKIKKFDDKYSGRWGSSGVRTTPIPNANDNSRSKYEFLKKKHAILIADDKLTKQIQILSSSQGKRATIAGGVVLIIYHPAPPQKKNKRWPLIFLFFFLELVNMLSFINHDRVTIGSRKHVKEPIHICVCCVHCIGN